MIGIWMALLLVIIAGTIGGAVNALMSDNGFVLPQYDSQDGVRILRPGYVGNMVIGAVSAAVSWGLYGPASGQAIIVDHLTPSMPPGPPQTALTIAGLLGAVLVGVAGARWLSSEVDKSLLRAAASQAALATKNEALAAQVAIASPSEALRAASKAKSESPSSSRL